MNHAKKIIIAISIILLTSIILTQQIQIYQLNNQIEKINKLKQYLLNHYEASSIEELKTKLTQETKKYHGNPFTTALYPGQFQAENITGMHWYTWLSGTLFNRTDTIAFPEQTATFIIFGKDTDGDGVYDIIYAKNCTSGQIEFNGTDAATVIQQAIDICPEWGKVCLKGEFIVTPRVWSSKFNRYISIAMKDHVTLEGGKLIAQGSDGFTVIGSKCHIVDEDLHGAVIRNVVIDAETYSPNVLDAIAISGSGSNYAYDCVLENIKIYGSKAYAIATAKSYRTIIRNIHVYRAGKGAVEVGVGSYNTIVDSVFAYNIQGDPSATPYPEGNALYIGDGAAYVTASNIHAIECAYQAVYLGSSHQVEISSLHAIDTPKNNTQPSSATIFIVGANEQVHIIDFFLDTVNRGDYALKINLTEADSHNVVLKHGAISLGTVYIAKPSDYILYQLKLEDIRFSAQQDAIITDSGAVKILVVEDCRFWDVQRSAVKAIGCQYVWILDNMLRATYEADNTYDIIDISGVVHSWIIGNMFVGAKAPRYGINMDTSTNIAHIYHNAFFNCPNPINLAGSNLYIHFNRGFITENSGTATIANGEWIPHGLVDTPTTVTVTTLTPTYDGVPVIVGIASKNATHIQISAYWTNGTAITDDAIDISWNAKYQP